MPAAKGQQGEGTEKKLFGGGYAPKITPEMTQGKPVVVTIESVSFRNFAQPEEAADFKPVLVYVEFPGHEHTVNRTGYKVLVAKLGEYEPSQAEFDGKPIARHPWNGKRVALAPVTRYNPKAGEDVEKLDIVPVKKWDAMMEAAAKQKRGR